MDSRVERPGEHYDPRPTSTVINQRDRIIEAQRERLHDVDLWAKRLVGPCVACRWSDGWKCKNPAVSRPVTDPVSGDIRWDGPLLEHERQAEYPERNGHGYTTDERWRERTLCGPQGLMFEPRTLGQVWGKRALHLLWIVPLTSLLSMCATGVISVSA